MRRIGWTQIPIVTPISYAEGLRTYDWVSAFSPPKTSPTRSSWPLEWSQWLLFTRHRVLVVDRSCFFLTVRSYTADCGENLIRQLAPLFCRMVRGQWTDLLPSAAVWKFVWKFVDWSQGLMAPGQGQGLSSRTTTQGYSEEWLTCWHSLYQ